MNEIETARKNELLKAMSATELAPLEVKNEISVQTYSKIPFQYREFYSLAYSQIENLSKSSLQAHLFGGLSAINKGAGTAIAKIPGINKSQIDETLIEAGERIGAYKNRRVQTTMQQLLERQSSCVRPFIDNINAVNRLYNEPVTLIFNHDTLYLGSTPDQT